VVIAAALVAAALAGTVRGPEEARGLLLGEIAGGGETLRYAVYLPSDYDASRRWPLALALHGRGESGTDGLRQLTQGLFQAILAAPGDWPVVTLFPQKPRPDREWEEYEPALLALLERAAARFAIDPDRRYLTGFSQGGHGTWVVGSRHPELWAAIVPVCGYAASRVRDADGHAPAGAFDGSPAELARPLRGMAVWAFHGRADSIVPVAETEAMIAALRAAGAAPEVTLIPGVDHGSWDPAYRDPRLPIWLLAQRRAGAVSEETRR
jgi:predicted peptidase